MTTVPPPPLQALEALVRRVAPSGAPLAAVEMPGGASTRRFFRVRLEPGRSAVAMWLPDAARPDEIAKVREGGRPWPFLEVRALLCEHGVRVPAIVAEACEDGLLLVEDLGDDTLARFIAREPGARERLYVKAVADLARAQDVLANLPKGSIVLERAFDEDLLRWEVDHFRQWALEARGVVLDGARRVVFDRAAAHLARTVAGWPRGFVHRDYQSRNLMVVKGAGSELQLAWIDFQDALLGPRVYDLVALLGDSYQIFDRAFIEARLDEYATLRSLGADERTVVGREFDIVTVQRKLKDAGRFVFIDREKGNPGFLEFVEPTIEKARSALARLKDDEILAALSRLLDDLFGARAA